MAERPKTMKGGPDRPLQPTAHRIRLAETVHGLENADMERIDLVRAGWGEEALIQAAGPRS